MRNLFLLICLLLFPFTASAETPIITKIEIQGEIEPGILAYIKRGISVAETNQSAAILFDIDTPGGRVDAALAIKDTILDTKIPTIAFINHNALSAGALISLAADQIYIAKGGAIGAATPVIGDVTEKAPEKIVSALRSAFASTAEANGYDPEIARAMVDEDIIIKNLSAEGKLLTLTAKEAVTYKIAKAVVENETDVLNQAGLSEATVTPLAIAPSEYIVRFVTSSMVASLLLTIGFLGMMLEFKAPGWGLAGLISLIAYGLFFWGHHLAGMAGIEDVILVAAGIFLIILELFIIPGFGIAGILGLIALFSGLILAMIGDTDFTSANDIIHAATIVVSTFCVGLALSLTALKLIFRKNVFSSGLVLKDIYSEKSEPLPNTAIDKTPLEIGETGTAHTDLRPAGTAIFGGQKFSVVSDGDLIRAKTSIRIIEIAGNRIVVTDNTNTS